DCANTKIEIARVNRLSPGITDRKYPRDIRSAYINAQVLHPRSFDWREGDRHSCFSIRPKLRLRFEEWCFWRFAMRIEHGELACVRDEALETFRTEIGVVLHRGPDRDGHILHHGAVKVRSAHGDVWFVVSKQCFSIKLRFDLEFGNTNLIDPQPIRC